MLINFQIPKLKVIAISLALFWDHVIKIDTDSDKIVSPYPENIVSLKKEDPWGWGNMKPLILASFYMIGCYIQPIIRSVCCKQNAWFGLLTFKRSNVPFRATLCLDLPSFTHNSAIQISFGTTISGNRLNKLNVALQKSSEFIFSRNRPLASES